MLLAHGSRSEESNRFHARTCRQLTDSGDWPVVPAFLEMAEPTLLDAIGTAIADGAQRIVVLPYFLAPGRHVTEDVPELIIEAGRRHPSVEIHVARLFGAGSEVLEAIDAQINGIEAELDFGPPRSRP